MESFILIADTDIICVNRSKASNVEDNILYRDHKGCTHIIDFEVCAQNFTAEYNTSSTNCIGERDISEGYFLFYTSGLKTKLIFKKKYVSNLFFHHFLSGTKRERFWQLQKMIAETKYTTYDLC